MPDLTKEYDEDIDNLVEEGRRLLAKLTRTYAPHPLDTEKIKPADARFDYQSRDRDYWGEKFAAILADTETAGGNLGDAVIGLYNHDREMREDNG